MKIISKDQQNQIAKRLGAIYYNAIHFSETPWEKSVSCIVENIAEIAFIAGGIRMMSIQIPAIVNGLDDLRFSKDVSEDA